MKQLSGFSFIELVIAVSIAAIISIAAYRAFNQTTITMNRLEGIVDYDKALTRVYYQLEKDISAAWVPFTAYPQTDAVDTNTSQQKIKIEQTEPEKTVEKVFYATQAKSMLQLLTCTTTTTLRGYNEQAPTIARVIYTLVPEKNSDTYTLTRQEYSTLEFEEFEKNKKTIQAFEIITNLKKLSATFIVLPVSEKEQEKKEFLTYTTWSSEEQFKKNKRRMPDYVELNGSWWDSHVKKERPFTFVFHIISKERPEEKKKKEQPALPEQQATKQQPQPQKPQIGGPIMPQNKPTQGLQP